MTAPTAPEAHRTRSPGVGELAELRAMATWLAAHDHPVFPLIPGGKTPATRNGFKDATTAPDAIAAWWARTPHNIGLPTGPARLCVIDLDTPKPGTTLPAPWRDVAGIVDGADVLAELARLTGQPAPFDTRTVATPTGGAHLYFTTDRPIRCSTSRLGPMIDVRAAGGYVVAPPSRTPVGAYVTINPGPIAPLPAWIADTLAPAGTPAPAARPGPLGEVDRYAFAAFEREVDTVLSAMPGARNDTLNRAAYALGRFVAAARLPEHHVVDALTIAAEHIGLPPHEAARTIASGLRAATGRPTLRGIA